jgi:hypothetical protein
MATRRWIALSRNGLQRRFWKLGPAAMGLTRSRMGIRLRDRSSLAPGWQSNGSTVRLKAALGAGGNCRITSQ